MKCRRHSSSAIKTIMTRPTLRIAPLTCIACCVLSGCGGGGGGSSTPVTTVTSKQPTAKTKADVGNNVASYGESLVGRTFQGPTFAFHLTPTYITSLGLYESISLSPDSIIATFYEDQAKTLPAGGFTYINGDATFTVSGPFKVTEGTFAGLTGNYQQAGQQNSSGVVSGYNGSVSFSVPKVATVDSQFILFISNTGAVSGTATTAVVLQSGYSQTEKVVYNADGSSTISSTDSVSLATKFSFAADTSGSGTITGSDPGLPATLTWDATGSGQVKFADGSTASLVNWALQA